MPKAIWNGTILAESDNTKVVEGNQYFPPDSINWEYFQESNHATTVNRNAAWYYAQPSSAAAQIKDHVAFWHGVKVVKDGDEAGENGLMDNIRNLFG
jgi:uncharacterized protein (DUF427 family)